MCGILLLSLTAPLPISVREAAIEFALSASTSLLDLAERKLGLFFWSGGLDWVNGGLATYKPPTLPLQCLYIIALGFGPAGRLRRVVSHAASAGLVASWMARS